MPALTWLHLSDLHFRTEDLHAWDEDLVLRRLLDDVRQHVAEGLAPDLIFVTGDLAFSGAPAEYALARAFFDDLLAATGLPKERLFPVPGNHDVDRSKITVAARMMAPNLTTREAVSEVQGDATARREFLARFEGYAAFLNTYFDHLSFDDAGYYYVHRLEGLAGGCLAVLGLNSAWLARGGDEDRGRLALGERQVVAALDAAAGASLRIALLHHPTDWLGRFDRTGSQALLARDCDFLLHGHLHETELTLQQTPDARAMVIAAGAGFETRRSANAYNLVRLDLEAEQGTVHLRAWSDRGGGFWTKDVLSYKNVDDGRYRFDLAPAPKKPRVVETVRPDTALAATGQRYRRHLRDRYRYLEFKGMGVSDRVTLRLPLVEQVLTLPLDEVYTSLTVEARAAAGRRQRARWTWGNCCCQGRAWSSPARRAAARARCCSTWPGPWPTPC